MTMAAGWGVLRGVLAALAAGGLYYLAYPPLQALVGRLGLEALAVALSPVGLLSLALWSAYLLETALGVALAALAPALLLVWLVPSARYSYALLLGAAVGAQFLMPPLLFMYYIGWGFAYLWVVRLLELALLTLGMAGWLWLFDRLRERA